MQAVLPYGESSAVVHGRRFGRPVNREQWLEDRQEWLRPAGAQTASSGDFKKRMGAGNARQHPTGANKYMPTAPWLFDHFSTMLNGHHDHLTVFSEAAVTRSHVSYDLAIKAAYFSLAAAALLFVSMITLTAIHP